jgi:hypothetical protein
MAKWKIANQFSCARQRFRRQACRDNLARMAGWLKERPRIRALCSENLCRTSF